MVAYSLTFEEPKNQVRAKLTFEIDNISYSISSDNITWDGKNAPYFIKFSFDNNDSIKTVWVRFESKDDIISFLEEQVISKAKAVIDEPYIEWTTTTKIYDWQQHLQDLEGMGGTKYDVFTDDVILGEAEKLTSYWKGSDWIRDLPYLRTTGLIVEKPSDFSVSDDTYTSFYNPDNTLLWDWNADMIKLWNGCQMFKDCKYLVSFTGNISSLVYSDEMFMNNTSLVDFNSTITSKTAVSMFENDCQLDNLFEDKTELVDGSYFYAGDSIRECTDTLPNLTVADYMFQNCTTLEKVVIDAPNITSAKGMFSGCSDSLQDVNAKNIVKSTIIKQIIESLPEVEDDPSFPHNISFDTDLDPTGTLQDKATKKHWLIK